MVYDPLTTIAAPDRALAVRYAPRDARPAVRALLALDDALARIVRTTREPMVGQMRLAWWDERLRALDRGERTEEPVLTALSTAGIDGSALTAMIDGWELLLAAEPLDAASLEQYAAARGVTLFAAIGRACGASPRDPVKAGGEGWALADLAENVTDADLAARARGLATSRLNAATRWSANARVLGALVHIARTNGQAAPARLARLIFHRFTGR